MFLSQNQSENDDIPQEPENLIGNCSYCIFYFVFLIDIIDITSPELQPMAVKYRCQVIQAEITGPDFCSSFSFKNYTQIYFT